MIIFIIAISFFLESIISSVISLNSLFNPLFTLISLVLIYPYFMNDDAKFLKYCGAVGLIYDLVFTNTFFLNMIVFIIIGSIIKLINITLSNNFINVMIITLLSVIFYLLITYFILIVIGYKLFSFDYFLLVLSRNLLLNCLYSCLVYLITDKLSKKYKILKID